MTRAHNQLRTNPRPCRLGAITSTSVPRSCLLFVSGFLVPLSNCSCSVWSTYLEHTNKPSLPTCILQFSITMENGSSPNPVRSDIRQYRQLRGQTQTERRSARSGFKLIEIQSPSRSAKTGTKLQENRDEAKYLRQTKLLTKH